MGWVSIQPVEPVLVLIKDRKYRLIISHIGKEYVSHRVYIYWHAEKKKKKNTLDRLRKREKERD